MERNNLTASSTVTSDVTTNKTGVAAAALGDATIKDTARYAYGVAVDTARHAANVDGQFSSCTTGFWSMYLISENEKMYPTFSVRPHVGYPVTPKIAPAVAVLWL